MNIDRLLTMLTRMFMNKAMGKGIDYAARRGKDPKDQTPEERAQTRRARDLAKRAKGIGKITRRF